MDRREPIDDALLELAACHAREYQSLHRQAQRIVGSPDAADDVVQEVFTETINTIRRGHEIRDLEPWLRVSVRNRALRRLGDRIFLPLDPELSSAGYETPAQIAQIRDQCRQVYGAVEQLGRDQRTAFLLAEVRGMRSEEIAGELDRTPAAARKLLMRARKQVRDAVGPDTFSAVMPLARFPQPLLRAAAAGGGDLGEQLAQRLAAVGDWLAAFLHRGGEALAQPAGAAVAAAAIIGAAVLFAAGDGTPTRAQDQLAAEPVAASPFELGAGQRPETGAATPDRTRDEGTAKGTDSQRPKDAPAGGRSEPFDPAPGAGNTSGSGKAAGKNAGGGGNGSSGSGGKNAGTAPASGNTTTPPAAGNTAPPSGGENTSPGSNDGGSGNGGGTGGGESSPPGNQPGGENPGGENPGGDGGGGDGGGNGGGNQNGNGAGDGGAKDGGKSGGG